MQMVTRSTFATTDDSISVLKFMIGRKAGLMWSLCCIL